MRPAICIVTPYLATANNGNWRTAARWQRFLRDDYRVILLKDWNDEDCNCLLALHARRSHPSIARFHQQYPRRPILLALTGTDLYRDLAIDDNARKSLNLARGLIVLQADAIKHVPAHHRDKAFVVYQSARELKPAPKRDGLLNCVMVAHLRVEKDPLTAFRAFARVPTDAPIFLKHIGKALDLELGRAARTLQRRDSRYRWLGPRSHAETRQAIKNAHLLLLPSIMEGGANVICEALTSGTPVLASEMSGNIGMLGDDYPGYFPVGDADALTDLLLRSLRDKDFLSTLKRTAQKRARLFSPTRERESLLRAVSEIMVTGSVL